MAVAYRASSRVGDTSGTSLALPAPTGTTTDDIVVAYLHLTGGATPSISGGNGTWTKITTQQSEGGGYYATAWWKRTTSADSGNYSITWSGTLTGEADAITLSGVSSSVVDPIESAAWAAINADLIFPDMSLASKDTDPALLLFASTTAAGTKAYPTSYTEVQDNSRLTSAAYRLPGAAGTYQT